MRQSGKWKAVLGWEGGEGVEESRTEGRIWPWGGDDRSGGVEEEPRRESAPRAKRSR